MHSARFVVFAALCATAVHPLAAQQEPGRVVRGLDFVGNRSIDTYTLKSVIATSSSSFFATAWGVRVLGLGAKRYFDELEFRRDVVRLIVFYRQSGFLSAVVDTTVRRTPRDVFITFRVYEGEPVRVTRLVVDGVEGIVEDRPLRRAVPLREGDPFNRLLFQASADTIAAWLRNRGYPYVQVLRDFDSDAAAHAVEVRFAAVPGPHVRVGAVLVQGVQRVDTATVLHTISVRPGEQYREDLLFQSQRDLYGTGTFRSANVTLLDSTPPAGSGSTVRVLVSVAEGPRHRIRVGGGYGTLDCFRAQSGWSAYGFLGGARVLDLGLRVSKIGVGWPLNAGLDNDVCRPLKSDPQSDTLNYNVALTLYQPAFLSPRHTASLGVFAERRSEFVTYTRTQVGANAGVTLNARRRVPVGVSYGYSVGRTEANPAVFCSVFSVCDTTTQADLGTRHAFASVTLTAARRTVDFPLDPASGSYVGITLLHSSRLIGSDSLYEFNRGELEVARYMPFGRRGVLAWRVRAGALLPARVTFTAGQSVRFVPPEQRFYAGGPNSVRGYRANELGPRVYVITDSSQSNYDTLANGDRVYRSIRTAPTGGNSILLANAEVRVAAPIFPDRLRVAAFVDVGQVYERQTELYSFRAVRVTPGVGVRVTTPLGPVRMDLAYNGYDLEPGRLLLQNDTTGTISEIPASYQRRRPVSFFRRLLMQFAIGQAF